MPVGGKKKYFCILILLLVFAWIIYFPLSASDFIRAPSTQEASVDSLDWQGWLTITIFFLVFYSLIKEYLPPDITMLLGAGTLVLARVIHPEDFLKGVELIYSQLFSFLENNNVQSMVTEKKKFDPYFHEALMKVDSDLPENMIIEELQKGFLLHDRVLRHAKVKISSGNKEKK